MPKPDEPDEVIEDPYENMSETDRAYFQEMEEKREREDDTLAEENRKSEYERNSRDDEDDKHDD